MWEHLTPMNRFFVCIPVVLVSCCVAAQTAAPDPPTTTGAPPAVTSTSSPEVQQFQKIENTWSMAVNNHDQYALENVLSPLFLDVAANGDITTRNQQIVQVISGDDKGVWLSQKVITVRMLGDTAVANGTYSLRHQEGSKPVEEKGVFTQVFERTHGGWMCLNSQRTLVREENTGKQKKKSSAEEPFHIPLFSRSDKDQ